LETARSVLEEVRRAASEERAATAAHILAVENRAHLEVDRARGELSNAARRISDLEKQLYQVQADSAKRVDALIRDLRRAEAESASLRVKIVAVESARLKAKPRGAATKRSTVTRTARKGSPRSAQS
jgi:hypothetical protein